MRAPKTSAHLDVSSIQPQYALPACQRNCACSPYAVGFESDARAQSLLEDVRMIDEIDWKTLEHAYGPATDTPAHLKALMSADADARDAAAAHIVGAVLHQGFPASATAAVARIVTRMLAENMVAPESRRDLVEFLGYVAIATGYAQKGSCFAEFRSALEEVVRESYPVVMRFLDAPDLPMRINATEAALSHVGLGMFAEQRSVLARRLLAFAHKEPEHRAMWVRMLGEAGIYTEGFLTDPDVHVRVSAALAPSLANNDLATEIIVEGLFHAVEHGVVDPWLYSLKSLVSEAIARVNDLQRIAAPAATIASREYWAVWEPLFLTIFRPRYRKGVKLSSLQRDFLAGLIENSPTWNYKDGNVELLFLKTGLPFQREACIRIVEEA
jgi:hypothetical protein